MKDFGSVLREMRHERRLSLDQLAGMADIHKSYLSRLENRDAPPPSEAKINALIRALDDRERVLERTAELSRTGDGAREAVRALEREVEILSRFLITTRKINPSFVDAFFKKIVEELFAGTSHFALVKQWTESLDRFANFDERFRYVVRMLRDQVLTGHHPDDNFITFRSVALMRLGNLEYPRKLFFLKVLLPLVIESQKHFEETLKKKVFLD